MLATPNVIKVPLEIAEHDQVQQAICVQIDPGSSGGPTASAHSSLLRHVCKSAVPIVVVELVASVGSDIEVLVSIVVIICGGDTHAVAGALQSRALGHVLKRSVLLLVVEAIPIRRSAFFRNGSLG